MLPDDDVFALTASLGPGDRARIASHMREIAKRATAIAEILDAERKERAKSTLPDLADRVAVLDFYNTLRARHWMPAVEFKTASPVDKAICSALSKHGKDSVMNALDGLLGDPQDGFWADKSLSGMLRKHINKGIDLRVRRRTGSTGAVGYRNLPRTP